ncbi:hypothetical protein LUZ60_014249 [Juncus effusus]|nr:hypothetical protein LUZ60_014249 [Juncus effusus]
MEVSEKEKIRREYKTCLNGVVSTPYNIPGTPFWKALKARAVILEMIEKMLNERIKETTERDKETKDAEDIIGWCLRESTFSKEQMLDLALTLFFTGLEATGYDIPKGWKVVPALSDVHLDSSLHDNPQRFNPWRWQDKSDKSSENFVPFGAGIRYCPGAELAKLEVSLFLHHLVLNYRWELAEHDEPVAIPFINFKKGLPIIVHKIRK